MSGPRPLKNQTGENTPPNTPNSQGENGKLSALKATNRIEAMDSAINLKEVRDMLSHEQSHRGRKRIVREFRLEYANFFHQ